MKKEELFKIANQFNIQGEPIKIKKIESGHINKTYIVECNLGEKYILQYVNTKVFPNITELMSNIKGVTEFIKKNKGSQTLTFIETKGENPSYIYNENWRMQTYIQNTISYISTDSLQILEEAGKAIGDFQKQLHGFDASILYEIIEKFHYTPNRLEQLNSAINSKENQEQRKERFEKAKSCIEFLTDSTRTSKVDIITKKLENGEIPLRVTHNDTKLSNILFDKETNKYKCLIDLDTIMPGSLLYDFGEGIRTGATTSAEDEQDLSKIYVDMNRFEAYTKGFLTMIKNAITKEELKLLPTGAWMMTYENAMRFLADYLNGDTYFAVNMDIPEHNLVRAKAQSEILRQMEEKEEKMRGVIEQYGL